MPTKEQAFQFALMLHGGLPSLDAISYFFPDLSDSGELFKLARDWSRNATVQRRIAELQGGKAFQEMTLDEKIRCSLDLHYAQLAYFLYSNNYATLTGNDRQKADVCRASLESKTAGTAGQLSPIMTFWDDIRRGKITLGQPVRPS